MGIEVAAPDSSAILPAVTGFFQSALSGLSVAEIAFIIACVGLLIVVLRFKWIVNLVVQLGTFLAAVVCLLVFLGIINF